MAEVRDQDEEQMNRVLSPRECSALGLRYQVPATSNVKNGCGVAAVIRAWELTRENGVPSRVLALSNGGGAHAVLIYRDPSGVCFSFDKAGSLPLEGVTETSPAFDVARAYCRALGKGGTLRSVTRAEWQT